MADLKIQLNHNGEVYTGTVMRITSTTLSLGGDDHGIMTAYVGLEGTGCGTSVGGYGLDKPVRDEDDKFVGRIPTAGGFDHLRQFTKIVGVDTWEALPGHDVLVLYKGENNSGLGQIAAGISSLDGKRVFIPKEHFADWKEKYGEI